jgi:hypothetical protein
VNAEDDPRTVTLITGETVQIADKRWIEECGARHIASLPTLEDRRKMLQGVERHQGKPAADRLKTILKLIWEQRP